MQDPNHIPRQNLDGIAGEISELKKSLHESRAAEQEALEKLSRLDAGVEIKLLQQLRQIVHTLSTNNCNVRKAFIFEM
jgi:hypothetical protein